MFFCIAPSASDASQGKTHRESHFKRQRATRTILGNYPAKIASETTQTFRFGGINGGLARALLQARLPAPFWPLHQSRLRGHWQSRLRGHWGLCLSLIPSRVGEQQRRAPPNRHERRVRSFRGYRPPLRIAKVRDATPSDRRSSSALHGVSSSFKGTINVVERN